MLTHEFGFILVLCAVILGLVADNIRLRRRCLFWKRIHHKDH